MESQFPGSDRVVLQRESGPVRNDSRNLEIMDLLIYHDSRQDRGGGGGASAIANECARFVFPAISQSYQKFTILKVFFSIPTDNRCRLHISYISCRLDCGEALCLAQRGGGGRCVCPSHFR